MCIYYEVVGAPVWDGKEEQQQQKQQRVVLHVGVRLRSVPSTSSVGGGVAVNERKKISGICCWRQENLTSRKKNVEVFGSLKNAER